MPIALLAFDFDPLLHLGDSFAVRWQTVALIVIVAAGLIVTWLMARRDELRADDLLFIAVATVPGAVIGGRVGYVLLHLDYYSANTAAIADPGQGSLELALSIVGGSLTGAYVAALLGAPIGRWLRAAALPLLLALGAGKLSMVLGGSGQGQLSTLPWSTAYVGAGPWGSLAPELPSHPSQAYEGVATLLILTVLTLAVAVETLQARDGRLFFVALASWALARAAISLTWRDTPVVVGLSTGGLIAVAIAIGSAAALIALARRRPGSQDQVRPGPDVAWADPETRPRF